MIRTKLVKHTLPQKGLPSLVQVLLIVTFALAGKAAGECSVPNFNVAPSFSVAAGPNSLALGDFNHDGKLDLAAAVQSSGVSILLGVGDATFRERVTFSTGGSSESIVVGDFNADGHSDLAVSVNADQIAILIGHGDGSFDTPTMLNGSAFGPTSLASGDFNADGRVDLAMTNANSNNVSVFLGTGSGSFTGPTLFAAGFGPSYIAVGQFNADTKLDLVVASSAGATILLGDGAGAFGPPASFSTAGGSSAVSVADFNSDGKSDLAVAHFFSHTLTVLFGTGTGTFTGSKNISAGNNARFVAAADIDGDGKSDLLIGNRDADTVSLMLGNGAGDFNQLADYGTGAGPVPIAIGDLNSDGKMDLVAGNVFSRDVSILIGIGGGRLAAPESINVYNPNNTDERRSGPGSVVSGDFNADGKADLAVANFFSNDISVMLGTGAGTFGGRTNFPAGTRLQGLVAGDFNRDGKTDLAAASSSPEGVSVLLGIGNGSFTSPVTFAAGSVPVSIAVGDFNRDAKLDLAVSNPNSATLSILLGDGGGGFSAPTSFAAGSSPVSIAVADFNSDGNSDLVVTNTFSSAVSLLLGNGLGGFGAPTSIAVGGESPASLVAGDFDGDGNKDLAVVNQLSGDLSVLLGTGTAAFKQHARIPLGFNPVSVILGDFNQDGMNDLAVGINRGNGILILLNDGTGVFAGPFNFYAGASPIGLAPADFNADGKADLAVTNHESDTITILVGTPVSLSETTQICAASYYLNEGTRNVRINVSRGGNSAGEAQVNYATLDGTASARSDYTTATGTLRFAPGETSKIITVLITDDALAEGIESFSVRLLDALGTTLGSPATATIRINDNETMSGPSPVSPGSFDVQFFVRQHYLDFFNREPDPAGLAFWMDQINSCGSDALCAEVKRINVSAAFFLSIEFQETGYLVERIYKTAFGDALRTIPDGSSGTKQIFVPIIRLQEFLPDTYTIGQGVIVGEGNWQQQLDNNKNSFALSFVGRQRFADAFPASMTPAQFVDKLILNAGIAIDSTRRDQLIAQLTAASDMNAGRASILRQVAESSQLQQAEFNRAFVLMQYYGYLRRNPDDAPDPDFRGWDFWLGKLNQFNGNFVDAEMVKAFLSSTEYRQRFGQ